MNRYRTYMDRIHAPARLRTRVLEDVSAGGRPRRPPRRALTGVLAAACFALAFFGAWQYWRAAETSPSPTAGVAATPAPVNTAPALDGADYTLVVADPFEGQPHTSPSISVVEFADCTDLNALSSSIALPQGHFREDMTAEEIIQALGGGDTVPWDLYWAGFGLTGQVIYDGQGQVWQAMIWGKRAADGAAFTLDLAPDQIPVRDVVYDVEPVDVEGLEVTAWYDHCDQDGDGTAEYICTVEFMHGAGVRFQVTAPDQESAAFLCDCLVSHAARTDGLFTVGHLVPDAIPQWRGEALTLEQARREELGGWLPLDGTIPAGFGFDNAWVELGQGRDWLHAYWCKGYDYIDVTVYRRTEGGYFPEADLSVDAVTAQALEALGSYVDDDAGDTPGWRWLSLTVAFTDDVRVNYSLKGVTPEQAAELITGGGLIREYTAYTQPVEPTPTPWQVYPLE